MRKQADLERGTHVEAEEPDSPVPDLVYTSSESDNDSYRDSSSEEPDSPTMPELAESSESDSGTQPPHPLNHRHTQPNAQSCFK